MQLVTVVGEPGIGKSRLVTELRTALDERPDLVTWRHGRCLPYGEGITFWALGEIVKAEAGILESDDPHGGGREARADASPRSSRTSRSGRGSPSRLGPLVGVGGRDSRSAREEAFTAWRRFLEALAARRPCVFVIEDLHWADDALLEFVEHLLDWARLPAVAPLHGAPGALRAQPELGWREAQRDDDLALAALARSPGRLLHLLLERTLFPAETQDGAPERAGGNPLYAEQFARMLVERERSRTSPFPRRCRRSSTARLDTLPPELKAVLQDASVVGRVFWIGAVAAIGGRDPRRRPRAT